MPASSRFFRSHCWRQRAAAMLLAIAWAASAIAAPARRGETIAGLGTLDFPTSTHSAPAQTAFVRGMLLLHLFEYQRAETAFQDAERLDPGFAMAYWGEAMTATHPVWNQQDIAAGRAALAKLAATPATRAAKAGSARERAYLAAVEILYGNGDKIHRDQSYLRAMTALARRYPHDDEAQLFQSLALLGVSQGERNVANYLRAAATAERVYAHNPQHPGAAHYWIHGMDDPAHAAGALVAANALSKIAPDAGHAQHMTAHIFMALGMWDEVVRANVNAIRVVNDEQRSAQLPVYSCGHYAEWLQYGYYQQGRRHEAMQVLRDCQRDGSAAVAWFQAHPEQAVPNHMTVNALKSRIDSSLIRMRAFAVVESPQDRQDSRRLTLDVSDVGRDAGWDLFAQGLAAAWSGDAKAADAASAALAALSQAAPGDHEDKNEPRYLQILGQMLDGVRAEREGRVDAALTSVMAAAKSYDALPFDFGPPVPIKPPHELAGELLLAARRPKQAVAEFDLSLRSAPRRALSLLGKARAQTASGDAVGATRSYRELQTIWQHADADLPETAEVRTQRPAADDAAPAGKP